MLIFLRATLLTLAVLLVGCRDTRPENRRLADLWVAESGAKYRFNCVETASFVDCDVRLANDTIVKISCYGGYCRVRY